MIAPRLRVLALAVLFAAALPARAAEVLGLLPARGATSDVLRSDTVTDGEARGQGRVPAIRGFGLRLGGITPLDPSGQSAGTGGGVFWQYDARSFLADVSIDLFFGRRYHDTAIGFGGYLPLTQSEVAPYLGLGLKYASTHFLGSWSAGLQPYLAGGVLVGRSSTVQLRAEVVFFHDLFTNQREQRNGLLWTAAVVF